MLRIFNGMSIALVILVFAGSTYAFAAANTGPTSTGGDGVAAVSGYDVTTVVYTLNASDPSLVDSVSFDLGAVAAAGRVKVQLVAGSGSWYGCSQVTGFVWSCNTSGLSLAPINQLRVIASSN